MTCSAPKAQEVDDAVDDSASAPFSNVVYRGLLCSDAVVDVAIDCPEPFAFVVLVDFFDLRTFLEEEADPAVLPRALEVRDSIIDTPLRD